MANVRQLRYLVFLKDAFWLGLTAFGGPQMHIVQFRKRLVDRKGYITNEELLDINALCQVLPGPSSTQTIIAIGYKLGGAWLAYLTLLCWMLPCAVLMSALALSPNIIHFSALQFMQPMLIGFIAAAVIKMTGMMRRDPVNYLMLALACVAGMFIRTPWVFPLLLVVGGFISANFGNRVFVPNTEPFRQIRWANFILFISLFVVFALAGRLCSRTEALKDFSKPVLLVENTYRTGALVYGGGNALVPILMDQYVYHKQKLSLDELNTGLGIVQAAPGPNFNIGAYVNGIAMKNYGYSPAMQLLGCVLGAAAIFLPGLLLVFFVYPIWGRLKTYPIVQRAMDGIFASSVGLVLAACVILFVEFSSKVAAEAGWWRQPEALTGYGIILVTFVLQNHTRVAPPFIVLGTMLAGYLVYT